MTTPTLRRRGKSRPQEAGCPDVNRGMLFEIRAASEATETSPDLVGSETPEIISKDSFTLSKRGLALRSFSEGGAILPAATSEWCVKIQLPRVPKFEGILAKRGKCDIKTYLEKLSSKNRIWLTSLPPIYF